MPLKKPSVTVAGEVKGGSVGCATLKKFPMLLSYLVDDQYDDGSRRQRSTFAVFVEGGLVKVALNDKEERRSLYVTAEGLHDALKALEASLTEDRGDWRPWNQGTKKK